MTSKDFIIREIEPKDNAALANVVRSVILEMGAPKVGTAYEDKATDRMFETYQKEKARYFVLEYENKIIGGAGIAQLDNLREILVSYKKCIFYPLQEARG